MDISEPERVVNVVIETTSPTEQKWHFNTRISASGLEYTMRPTPNPDLERAKILAAIGEPGNMVISRLLWGPGVLSGTIGPFLIAIEIAPFNFDMKDVVEPFVHDLLREGFNIQLVIQRVQTEPTDAIPATLLPLAPISAPTAAMIDALATTCDEPEFQGLFPGVDCNDEFLAAARQLDFHGRIALIRSYQEATNLGDP